MAENNLESIQLNQMVDLDGGNISEPKDHFRPYYRSFLNCCIAFLITLIPVLGMFIVQCWIILTPICAIVLFCIFCKGVSAFSRIKKGTARQYDKDYALPSIVLSIGFSVVLLISSVGVMIELWDYFGISGYYQFRQTAEAFDEFKECNDGKLPSAETWCDDFNELKGIDYDVFKRVSKKIGYGYNRYLTDVTGEVPDDMVVFFECEPGWNVCGGPELAKAKWYHGFVSIVFGDGSRDKFRQRDVKYLRWKIEDDGVVPVRNKTLAYIGYGACVSGAIVFLVARWKKAFDGHEKLLIGISLGAILAGGVGGFWAESLYLYNGNLLIGWIGALIGLAAGVIYVLMLGTFADGRGKRGEMLPFAVVSGAVEGVVCSCVVHGYLMIAYEYAGLLNMATGAIFGASAGIILGWISSSAVKRV